MVGQARCNTQFTCFSGTKVRILTSAELQAAVEDAEAAAVEALATYQQAVPYCSLNGALVEP